VIPVVFWVGVVICVLVGLMRLFVGIQYVSIVSLFSALFTIIVGPLLVRVSCELTILLFRIYDTLQEIKEQRKS
jgi:hypothetical protein